MVFKINNNDNTGPHRIADPYWNQFIEQHKQLNENINKLEELQAQMITYNEIQRAGNIAKRSKSFPNFITSIGQSVNVLNRNRGIVSARTMGRPMNIYITATGRKPQFKEVTIEKNGERITAYMVK